jgi:hypothetical protein
VFEDAMRNHESMTRGEVQMNVAVVPDSGTEELVGLTGRMTIVIKEGGNHFYEFAYTLVGGR